MITLKLKDRNGTPLNWGDIVAISDGINFSFYAKVQYNEETKHIVPFHTFSFHSILKVDKIPETAKKLDGDYWFNPSKEKDEKESVEKAKNYLIEWRKCERFLKKSCFDIEIIQ